VTTFLEPLSQVGTAAILVFVVSSMMAIGLGHTVQQILAPLRNMRLVFRATQRLAACQGHRPPHGAGLCPGAQGIV
jgi:hypothetical protein